MKLITSFLYSLGTKIFSLSILLISRILTARLLGPSDFGSIGNALNLTTIISRWGSLGIAPATQFTSSKYSDRKNTILIYAVLISILVGSLNLLLLSHFDTEINDWQFSTDSTGRFAYAKFSPWMPLIILSMTLPIFLLGLGQIRKYSLTQTLPLVFQTVIIATAFLKEEPLHTIIFAQVASWIFTVAIAVVSIDFKSFVFKYDSGLLLIFIKYALQAWPQIVLQFGISRFAVLIGSQYLSTKELGYYILAANISESFLLLITSVSPLIFNRVASQGTNPELLARTLRVANTLLLLALLFIFPFGKPVFLFVFGIEFKNSWNLILLLMGGVFFQGTIRICINYIAALGKNMAVSVILLIQITVLFATGVFACPYFGPSGLCYATIAASMVGFVLCLNILRKSGMQSGLRFLDVFVMNSTDIRVICNVIKNASNV